MPVRYDMGPACIEAPDREAVAVTHFLDSLPFDWTDPGAQELRDLLAGTFFRVDQVVLILQQAGIAPAAIALERPVYQVWHSVIEQARNEDRLRQLLAEAAQLGGEAVALRLKELTAVEPVVSVRTAGRSRSECTTSSCASQTTGSSSTGRTPRKGSSGSPVFDERWEVVSGAVLSGPRLDGGPSPRRSLRARRVTRSWRETDSWRAITLPNGSN